MSHKTIRVKCITVFCIITLKMLAAKVLLINRNTTYGTFNTWNTSSFIIEASDGPPGERAQRTGLAFFI
jgi:hypothetical protein